MELLSSIGFSALNVQSLLGIIVFLGLCWLISENKRKFPFGLLIGGLGLQLVLVLGFFALPGAQAVLESIGHGVEALSKATDKGTQFIFGYLGGDQAQDPYVRATDQPAFIFALKVLPLIIFISALSALLWHWHILKWIIWGFGMIFRKTIGLGGASALGVSSGIFLGNVESLILIKAYLEKLTRSELFLLMVVGLANVAGSTMIAYVGILSGVLPHAAGHILAASIISAPAAVLMARIILPEVEKDGAFQADYESALKYDSSMDAVTKGTSDGLQVAVSIAAILIVMVAFAALIDQILTVFGPVFGAPLSLSRLLGYVFSPLAWLIGVEAKEVPMAGNLLGVKMVLTEFVAFIQLGNIPLEEMSPRTRMLLTYALCGFANIGSVGISVTGFSVLMPDRRADIMALIWKALVAGFLATCLSAAVVGIIPESILAIAK